MASTGQQTTWNGNFYLKIVWDIQSQSVANNTSSVRVRMYLGAKSGWSLSDSTNSWSLSFDGASYSGSNANLSINGNEQLFATYTRTISHSSNGTKSISLNGSISGLYFGGINPSSFSGTLDAIPRASTISSTASLNAESNSNIGVTRYSSSFSHTLDIYLTKSGVSDKLIKQLSYSSSVTSRGTTWDSDDRYEMFRYGHGYWTGTKMVLKTYSGSTLVGTSEKTGSFSYPSNNSVGSISSFTLGNNANVSISKASSLYSHQIELRIGSTLIGSNGISSGENFSIAINPTTVLNALPTSKTGTVTLSIRTVLSTNTAVEIRGWTNEASATVTIPSTYAPTFTASQFTYADTNTTTVGITGSNQTLISGLSTLQVNINSVASVSTGATITSYSVIAGDKSGSRVGTGAVSLGAVKSSSSTVQITVTATDSRGFQTSASKTVNILPYQKPTIVGNATRNNGFDETVTLRTSGVVNRLVVGGVAKNNISTLQYRTKLTTASWVDTWTPIPFTAPTGTNTTYTASNVTLTIPSLESWNVEVKATDTLGSVTSVIYTVSAGTPLVFIDTNLNSVGVNKFPDKNYAFDVGLEWGDFSVYSKQSTVGNNESTVEFKTKQDPNGGVQLFTREDSSGWWDRKDGRTVLRYVPLGGNSATTGYDKGDLIIDPVGKMQISANGESLRLRSSDHGYMTFYNGSQRQGFVGQSSASNTGLSLHAENGNLSLSAPASNGYKIILNAINGVEASARLSANLTHKGGYFIIEHFSPSYGAGQAELWYRGDERLLTMTSRNPGDTGESSLNVKAHRYIADAYEAPANTTGYLQCSPTSEFRVTEYKTSGNYRPIRASSFPTGSSINYKTNLENIDVRVNALELIKETDIWHYHLKSNLEGGIYDKPKVGVIAEMVNPLIRDEDGVDTYSMIALSWKAHQQQDAIIKAQAQEIEDLKAQNEAIFDMLQDLQNQIDSKG